MELEFDVHVDANALYDYMLRHTFTKAAGILGSTAGALGIVVGMMQRYPIYVIFGAVVLLYQPVSLWLRAQKQALLVLLKQLKEQFPNAVIHGHRDFAQKACPCFDATNEYAAL